MAQKIDRSFATHDGHFHADEVTACALLLFCKLIDRDKILRTRNFNLLSAYQYVCDVGGEYDPVKKRFDHHQSDYQGPLSSAGMILEYLCQQGHLDKKQGDFFREELVFGVDAHDNGAPFPSKGYAFFSQIISLFNPLNAQSNPDEELRCFFEAVDFTLSLLTKMQQRSSYIFSFQAKVKTEMEKQRECLIFDVEFPWLDLFFDLGGESHPAQFLIMPSKNHWKLRAIPPNKEQRMNMRTLLPQAWAGKQGEALIRISEIPGAIFCHKNLFVSIWQTKEDAIKALEIATG